MPPNKWRNPGGPPVLGTDFAIRAPSLLAGLFVERSDVLLLFIVVDDDQQVPGERRRTSRPKIEVNWTGFKRRRPHRLARQVKSPQPEVRHIDVNKLPVGYRAP